MTVFLCDGECEYSYDDLLRHLNQDNYFPLLKTHHLFSYFGNLVKALTNDVPLVLLDSDLSPAELDGVDESLVNQSIPLSVKRLPSMGEVIEALVHSTSEITMFTSGQILCFAVRSAVLNFTVRKQRKTESGNVSARTAEKLLPLHGEM